MPVHDWSYDPPIPYETFHALWIAEIVRGLNRGILPQGYRAYVERHLGILQPDVTTFREQVGHAASTTAVAPREWETTAILDYEPSADRYAVRVDNGDGRPVAFLELVSRSNKDCAPSLKTFIEHLSVHIADGLHLVLVDWYANPAADLHWELLRWSNDQAEQHPAEGGPLYVCSYRNLAPASGDQHGRLEACVRRFDIGHPLPVTTLWLREDLWVLLDLEHFYLEVCTTMRID